MDCSLPGSSVHEILQGRILEWVAISFSRGISQPRIEPGPPTLQADSLPSEPSGSPGAYWSSPYLLWACLAAQLVKNPPAMQETPVRFLGREDLLEKG